MNFRSITIFLIGILFAVHVHAQGGGGSVSDRIVVSIVNQPLSDAIRAIEANSKYTFFYDTNKTDLSQKVSLNARNIPVAQALGQMLSATDLDFEITNNQIALFPRRQAVRVAGTVMDARSVPLPGVTVVVDGTNSGTVTDGKGNFIVPVPSFPVQLNF